MWRYGGVTEEKKKSMGRYPWNLRPEKSKKPRVATHGLFGAFKEKQGIFFLGFLFEINSFIET